MSALLPEEHLLRRIAIVFSIPAFVFFLQIYPRFLNPNEASRLLLTSAIADDHTVAIDQAIRRYEDVGDKSVFEGRTYAAKSVGYSAIAVPFYVFLPDTLKAAGLRPLGYGLHILVNLIALAAFTFFFFRYLRDSVGAGSKAYLLIAAFLFGTLIYPFAQLFISHVLTGICWFLAFAILTDREGKASVFIAGALLGLSFLLEIPSAVTILVFTVWIAFKRTRLLPYYLVGLGLLALPSFLFNLFVFHHPLHWAYEHVASLDQAGHKVGYIGISTPSLQVLWNLTFGNSRGFFYYMPHLIFGAYGIVSERRKTGQALLAGAIILLNFLFYSGYSHWDGGWSFGPRFLIPTIPFFIYGCALWFARPVERHARLKEVFFLCYLALLSFTIPLMLYGTATFPFTTDLPHGVFFQNMMLYWRGCFGTNAGDFFGLAPGAIQTLSILLVCVPVAALLQLSRIKVAYLVSFLSVLLLLLMAGKQMSVRIEQSLPARYCLVAGRTAYYQGHDPEAVLFLVNALRRNPIPEVRGNAIALLSAIETTGTQRHGDRKWR